MAFERVYTVWDYYDGPREGIADFQGRPHYYESRWDSDADDWSSFFALVPIDQETLQFAMEQWEIWLTWERKFRAGELPLETHPGHGGMDARYDELESLLETRIPSPSESASSAVGEFRVVDGKTEVEWRLPRNPSLERTRER